jgi:hypothetical protein
METVARMKAHTRLCGSAVYRQSSLSSEGQERIADSNSVIRRLHAGGGPCEIPIACHIFSVAGRPIAGDFVARVKGGLKERLLNL